jgi:hypothetical protein
MKVGNQPVNLHNSNDLRHREQLEIPDINVDTGSEFPFGLFSRQQHELLDRISTDLWNLHVSKVGADN